MSHLVYLAVLAGCLLVTPVLEYTLRVRIYAQWRRLVVAVLPVAVLFSAWDLYAIHHHQWSYARRWITGVKPAGLPIEELLFFVVIPICAIATLEAVRRVRPQWLIGDESGESPREEAAR